ncbi:MAG: MoxR family ATPase, partial [Chloroflexi bacterium]|nr:MoxR family ATPase [Chloroflexota bacterium]
AQLDRFAFKLLVDYAPLDVEKTMLRRYHQGFDARRLDETSLQVVLDREILVTVRAECQAVAVAEDVIGYIAELVRATRSSNDVVMGASPRAAITILLGSKVLAALSGRDYVLPDDVKRLAPPALRHRILLKPEAEIEGLSPDLVIQRLVARVDVPR